MRGRVSPSIDSALSVRKWHGPSVSTRVSASGPVGVDFCVQDTSGHITGDDGSQVGESLALPVRQGAARNLVCMARKAVSSAPERRPVQFSCTDAVRSARTERGDLQRLQLAQCVPTEDQLASLVPLRLDSLRAGAADVPQVAPSQSRGMGSQRWIGHPETWVRDSHRTQRA